ncbi:MAG: hypothetical protein WAL47_20915, partial [Pyrinomonadaceae bacterium]
MGRLMRSRRVVAFVSLAAVAGLVAVACTSDGDPGPSASTTSAPPVTPSASAGAEPADSAWSEPTDVMGAPNLVSEPDPALAPQGVD